MTTATSLVASLRASGISIWAENRRLLVEAPQGTITPEIRSQLTKCKGELISTLEFEEKHRGKDPVTVEASREVASLLVAAYRRWQKIPRIPEVLDDPPKGELALSPGQSVHGCEQR